MNTSIVIDIIATLIFLQDSMMITIFITIHPSIMDAPLLHQLYDTLPLL